MLIDDFFLGETPGVAYKTWPQLSEICFCSEAHPFQCHFAEAHCTAATGDCTGEISSGTLEAGSTVKHLHAGYRTRFTPTCLFQLEIPCPKHPRIASKKLQIYDPSKAQSGNEKHGMVVAIVMAVIVCCDWRIHAGHAGFML